MKRLLLSALFFAFQATAQSPMISTEIELSPEAKQEIAQKAAPELRRMYFEAGCKGEADFFMGLNPQNLNLALHLMCVEPKEPDTKAETKREL